MKVGHQTAKRRIISEMSTPCTHARSEKRKRTLTTGIETVVLQCLDCGSAFRSLPKKGEDFSKLTEYDPTMKEAHWSGLTEKWKLEHEEKQSAFWTDYSGYLNSDHWHRIRQRVLHRDPVCQVCFIAPAVQAHHLSYESYKRFGMSFSVECVGVCVDCHTKIHQEPHV